MTRRRLFRWVLLVTLAEAAGFMVPTAGMALTAASSRPILALVTMVLAGSVEGAVLGSAQADCLYRWRVLPVRRWWIIATSLGAAFAWSLGMLSSTLGGVSWTARTAVGVGIGGLMLLTSLPLAQYFVLRDHVERASLWIPINVAVLLASALLATELLVQIPFLGFSVLQLIFGTVALGMAVVGLLARSAGWWPSRSPVVGGLRPARPEEP
jgi:hypothetical protein